MRAARLIAAVSLPAVLSAGCSLQHSSAVRRQLVYKTTTGYVNIARVEALDPRMMILASVNREIAVDESFADVRVASPVDRQALAYIAQVESGGGSDRGRSLLLAQHQRLSDAESIILSVLAQRLAAADQSRLNAIRSEQVVKGSLTLQTLIGQYEDQAAAEADQDTVDSARVASLKMQISAMKLNELPPPTAPKGHWAALESSREAELVTVLSQYDAKLQQIFESRNRLIEVEKTQIAQSIATGMQQQSDRAAVKRGILLNEAEQRFSSEQADLAAETEQIFNDAEALTHEPVYAAAEQSMNGGDPSSVFLKKYRSQLEASILTDAYATVASISQELHLKIVRQGSGVRDVTARILQSARDRSWKLS